MQDLFSKLTMETGLPPAEAAKPLQMVLDYLKARLPEPTTRQPDVVVAGADVRELVDKLFEAIEAPIRQGDSQIVGQVLAQGVDTESRNLVGQTPLHVAAFWGRSEIAALLVLHGADVNSKDSDGATPLRVAAQSLSTTTQVEKLLLAAGAEQDIFSACLLGQTKLVATMLDETPGLVDAEDCEGNTPLHLAVCKGRKEAAQLLLDRGANVMARDHRALTPLHKASDCGHVAVAELLISAGAEINAKEMYWKATPLDMAEQNCGIDSPIARCLQSHGGIRGDDSD